MTVTLVSQYNPAWPESFEAIRSRIEPQLAGVPHRVEHVGSTAIPGMVAKPIIDVDIVIERTDFAAIRERLARLGYVHVGDKGIPDREAFDLTRAEGEAALPAHHLYVCMADGAELRKHLSFRDFMRTHPEWVKKLSAHKVSLCEQTGNDREAYMDGKSDMVQEITELAKKASEPCPLASIVIVNWNGLRWLRQLLPGLHDQSFRDFEIVIVDNGSSDGSLEFLRQSHPDVRIVPLKENAGFAAGSNAGIRAGRGKYVVLLNNDTRPERDWLAELVRAAEADPAVGMCAPLILDADRVDLLDSAGIAVWWDGFSRQMRHGEPVPACPPGRADLPEQECLAPSGCAGLYRREMLDRIGLLDEDFFCYCEDTDLGLRARFAGWKCVLVPGARVHHYYSQSGGRALAKKIFWVERNHYCVAIKNYPWFLILLLPLTSLWRLASQLFATLHGHASGKVFRGDLSIAGALRAFAAAYLSLLARLPRMFLKRRRVQSTRKLSARECYRLIRKYQVSVSDIVFN